MKTIKKTVKKEVKKEVWDAKLDKTVADFKANAIKNGNVSLCMVTTDSKNQTECGIINHHGNTMVFAKAFLKSMDKSCPEALRMAMLHLVTEI